MWTMLQNARMRARRRSRPLTSVQERLFFGVLFAIAVLIQAGAVWSQIIR